MQRIDKYVFFGGLKIIQIDREGITLTKVAARLHQVQGAYSNGVGLMKKQNRADGEFS